MLYSQSVEKTLVHIYFDVIQWKRKTGKKNIVESLFLARQTLTYDDTTFTSIPKVCDNSADQT